MVRILLLIFILILQACSGGGDSGGGLVSYETDGSSESDNQTSQIIPVATAVFINSGEAWTNSLSGSLTLSATSAQQMSVSQNQNCTDGENWEPYSTNKAMTLVADSTNTFYFKVKSSTDDESTCISANIIHDTVGPTVPTLITPSNDGSDIATDTTSWSGATDPLSGILSYEYAVSTSTSEVDIIAGAGWTDTNGATSYQIDSGVSLVGLTNYYTLIRVIDNVGNVSSTYAVSPAWQITVSPELVTNLEASATNVNDVALGWSMPADNGTPVTDYIIEYKGGLITDWTVYVEGTSPATTASITGLDSETQYTFRVKAFNGINYSGYSNELVVTTLPNVPFLQAGYKAINIGGATKSRLVSMEDGNTISFSNGDPDVTINKGETVDFNSSDFDTIEATGAFYVAGKLGTGSGSSDQGNITWATNAWVGKDFYFNLSRSGPLKVKVYAFTDSTIEIYSGAVLKATTTIVAGTGHEFSLTDLVNYQMTSTGYIIGFTYANQSGLYFDPKPLLPASTDIIGIPSKSMKASSGTDGNNIMVYSSSNSTTAATINSTTIYSQNGDNSALFREAAFRVISNDPMVAFSSADSNGYCAAPFLPVSMQQTKYAINTDSAFAAFASDRPVTLTITLPDNSTVVKTLTRTAGNSKNPYKAYIEATDLPGYSVVPEGMIIEGSDVYAAWYQPNTSAYSGGEDETILFGW